MTTHLQAKPTPTHRSSVWKYLKTKLIKDEHLNFDFMVLGFKIAEGSELQEEFWKISQILLRLGFKIEKG